MRNLVLILLLSITALTTQAGNQNCISTFVGNRAVFNLLEFSKSGPFSLFDPQNVDDQITFSICTPQVPGCASQTFGTRTMSSNPNYCEDIALDTPSYEFLNSDDHMAGLKMRFPGVKSSSGQHTYQMVVNLECSTEAKNANETQFAVQLETKEGEATTFKITGSSIYGCPVASLDSLVAFLEDYEIVFVIFFFGMGFFINLYGLRMFNITMFVISFIFGTFAAAAFFYHFTDLNTENWILWFIFFVCSFIGAALGFLAVRYKQVGFFGMGFGLGVIIALLVYQYIISSFIGALGEAFLYGVAAIFGVIGGYIATKFWKGMIIIATSFIGAYMIIRSVSVYAGGFPNEIELAEGHAEFEWWAVAYLVFLVLMTIIGITYQSKNKQPEDEARLAAEELKSGSRYSEILLEGIDTKDVGV